MVKKLRYYARFIVVCLLLNKRQVRKYKCLEWMPCSLCSYIYHQKVVQELAAELQSLVDEYIKAYKPPDTLEWQYVLQEIELFLKVLIFLCFSFFFLKHYNCGNLIL
jgi:hypothetical protein